MGDLFIYSQDIVGSTILTLKDSDFFDKAVNDKTIKALRYSRAASASNRNFQSSYKTQNYAQRSAQGQYTQQREKHSTARTFTYPATRTFSSKNLAELVPAEVTETKAPHLPEEVTHIKNCQRPSNKVPEGLHAVDKIDHQVTNQCRRSI